MDLAKLGTLKIKLISGTDFEPILAYFMDNFGENDEFMKLGGPLANADHHLPGLVTAAAAAALQSAGIKVNPRAVGRVVPIHLPEEQFLHGAMTINGCPVIFFYFDDLDVGLMYVHLHDGTGRTLRLTMRPAERRV